MRIIFKEFGKNGRSHRQPKEINGDYRILAKLILDPMVVQVWAEDKDGKLIRIK